MAPGAAAHQYRVHAGCSAAAAAEARGDGAGVRLPHPPRAVERQLAVMLVCWKVTCLNVDEPEETE